MADLTSLIFSRAHPKRFGSTFMTGPLLAGLVGAYVGAINQGAVPTIATAWQVGEGGVPLIRAPGRVSAGLQLVGIVPARYPCDWRIL